MTRRRLLRPLAYLLVIGLVVVAVAPIQFSPVSPVPTQHERAPAEVGLVFALAYSLHLVLMSVLLFASTALFEALPKAEPRRHG